MRFATWNVGVYRVGSMKSVVGELEKCKLDLVGIQEVRWEGGGGYQIANKHFSMEKGRLIIT
jgi:exonuclease III